jgi:hypothetical protein
MKKMIFMAIALLSLTSLEAKRRPLEATVTTPCEAGAYAAHEYALGQGYNDDFANAISDVVYEACVDAGGF